MANIVDTDEIVRLIWVYTVCSHLSVQKFRNITVAYEIIVKNPDSPFTCYEAGLSNLWSVRGHCLTFGPSEVIV